MENTILDIRRSRAPKVDMTKMTERDIKKIERIKIPICQSLCRFGTSFRALQKIQKTSKKN